MKWQTHRRISVSRTSVAILLMLNVSVISCSQKKKKRIVKVGNVFVYVLYNETECAHLMLANGHLGVLAFEGVFTCGRWAPASFSNTIAQRYTIIPLLSDDKLHSLLSNRIQYISFLLSVFLGAEYLFAVSPKFPLDTGWIVVIEIYVCKFCNLCFQLFHIRSKLWATLDFYLWKFSYRSRCEFWNECGVG